MVATDQRVTAPHDLIVTIHDLMSIAMSNDRDVVGYFLLVC
jgi:hypothetical protein